MLFTVTQKNHFDHYFLRLQSEINSATAHRWSYFYLSDEAGLRTSVHRWYFEFDRGPKSPWASKTNWETFLILEEAVAAFRLRNLVETQNDLFFDPEIQRHPSYNKIMSLLPINSTITRWTWTLMMTSLDGNPAWWGQNVTVKWPYI